MVVGCTQCIGEAIASRSAPPSYPCCHEPIGLFAPLSPAVCAQVRCAIIVSVPCVSQPRVG